MSAPITHPLATLTVELPDDGYHRRLISCQVACPVHTDARGYVRAIAAGNFEEAYLIARGPNPFASICGRICAAPCEAACRRGLVPRVDDLGRFVGTDRPIAIRALKRFVCEQSGPEARPTEAIAEDIRAYVPHANADAHEMAALIRSRLRGGFPPGKGESVAIIGAGPAGLSAAHDLALMGFRPTVFEVETVAAGMLAVGVPAYRLPRAVIEREVAVIQALGVEIRTGVKIGREISFADLRQSNAAVIIAVGAKRARLLGLPGEQGPGVYGGVDLLRAVSLGEPLAIGRHVVVIGGGNVAYDVARTVVRQAALDTARTVARLPATSSVTLASLESLEEMPADTLEIQEGDEEGVERLNGWGPMEILRDAAGMVTGVAFRRCTRVYDTERKFAPEFVDSERRTVACDTVLIAAGQAPDLGFLADGGADIEELRPGWPRVDAVTLATTAAGIFVAGDLAHGTRLLIDAVASGKKAARSVYAHITGRTIRDEMVETHLPLPGFRREMGYERLRRVEIPTAEPAARMSEADAIVEIGYDAAQAQREASRCLDCGVTPVFDGSRCILCGGCAEVCPTKCLKIVSVSGIVGNDRLDTALEGLRGPSPAAEPCSAILKDEDRCIRCALCAARCPVDAITMERLQFTTQWSVR